MPERDAIRTKIIVGVVTSSILAILAYIGREWWPPVGLALGRFFVTVWSWLNSGHSVNGWLILLFAICTAICGFVLIGGMLGIKARQSSQSYRQDAFFGIVWRWDYFGGDVDGLTPFCPHCDTRIVPQHDYEYGHYGRRMVTQCVCDHCLGFNQKLDEPFPNTLDKVTRQIHRKIRNGEWQKVVSAEAEAA